MVPPADGWQEMRWNHADAFETVDGPGWLLLIPVFALPLWSIRIVAPQYNDGLGMFIGLRDIWGHTSTTSRTSTS
jgi:hypothetical protein